MHPRWPTALAAAALGGTVALFAQTEAPLATSKRELQELSIPARTPLPAEAGQGKSLPRLTIQAADNPGTTFRPPPQSNESLKEKSARANWLVNGVRQLEQREKNEAAVRNPNDRANPPKREFGAEEEFIGEANPLREASLWDETRSVARKPPAPAAQSASVDPLAPFLSDWMSNSPVQGKFFDQFANGAKTPAGTATPSDFLPPDGVARKEDSASVAATELARVNPYLPNGEVPNSGGLKVSAEAFSQPIIRPPEVENQPAAGNFFPAPVSGLEPLPAPKKNQPAPFSDDKKYFPQLKKF